MGRACSTHGTDENCIHYFDRKPEGKEPLGTSRRRWEDNIKMDLRITGWEAVS